MSATLPTRKIGTSDVTAIGWGAMGLSVGYGTVRPDEERLKLLDAVYENGCLNWDTADVYGDSEELLGKWFKRTGKRNEIFLATKVGIYMQNNRTINGDPEYIKSQCAKSLQRLGVESVDLYYLHRPDSTVPIEKSVGAMAELVKEGKVKYLGLSECSSETLRRANAVHPIAAVQVEYSPFTLDMGDEKIGLFKTAKELGVSIVAYSPLGRGLVTGRFKGPEDFEEGDFRLTIARYSKENFPNILKIADGLKTIGEQHNATAGQVALAWLLAQGDNVIPIPGTMKEKYLKENLCALDLKLTQKEVDDVREIVNKADATGGERYPPILMDTLFANTPPLGN